MIEEGINQKERLEKLNLIARKQLQLLIDDKNIMGIEDRILIEDIEFSDNDGHS